MPTQPKKALLDPPAESKSNAPSQIYDSLLFCDVLLKMTSMQVTGWLCASHDNDDLRDWHFLRWMFQRWAIKKMKCNNYHSIMQINVKKFTNWYELHFDIRPLSLLLKSSIWRTQTCKTFVFHPLSRFLLWEHLLPHATVIMIGSARSSHWALIFICWVLQNWVYKVESLHGYTERLPQVAWNVVKYLPKTTKSLNIFLYDPPPLPVMDVFVHVRSMVGCCLTD